jgi:flavin-dependent dehydrogenase
MRDFLIIGSGPAGASAARLLAQAGRDIALIEKAEFPRRKVCGEFISQATLAVLDDCGVGRDFRTLAGPLVRCVALWAGDADPQAPLPAQGGRALGRERLDVLLRDAAVAAGADLIQPAELIALERKHGAFHATLDNGERLEARSVIAACGSWNAKGPFAITAPARPSDLLGFKAHFQNSRLPEGLMPLLAFPGGYGGMVHSDGGRVSLSCCIRRDVLTVARARHGLKDGKGRAADAVFAHIAATTRSAARALDGAVADGAFLSAGPIRPRIRPRYRDGIFFTGNLAGEAHPVIAEGISMAMQSSALLARILIEDDNPDSAGARYSTAWFRKFAPRIAASHAFAHMAMTGPARAAASALVQGAPSFLTLGARFAGKAL